MVRSWDRLFLEQEGVCSTHKDVVGSTGKEVLPQLRHPEKLVSTNQERHQEVGVGVKLLREDSNREEVNLKAVVWLLCSVRCSNNRALLSQEEAPGQVSRLEAVLWEDDPSRAALRVSGELAASEVAPEALSSP